MLTEVKCELCHTTYQMQSSLGGKKVTCKCCGNVLVVPLEPGAEGEAAGTVAPEVPATRMPAPAVPLASGSSNFRRTFPATAGPAGDADPVISDLEVIPSPGESSVPAASMEVAEGGSSESEIRLTPLETPVAPGSESEIELRPVPAVPAQEVDGARCPSCKAVLAPGATTCGTCGFGLGGQYEVNAAVASPPLLSQAIFSHTFDWRGMRLNVPYAHPFFAWLDGAVMVAGQFVFWGIVLILLLTSIVVTYAVSQVEGMRWYAYPLTLGGMPLLILLWVLVQVPISSYAVGVAGLTMKFHLPDEPRWRVLTAQVMGMAYAVLGWLVVFPFAWLASKSLLAGLLSALSISTTVALFSLPIAIPTHFLVSWLVLRLRFAEAVVAWVFQCLAMALFAGLMVYLGIFIREAIS